MNNLKILNLNFSRVSSFSVSKKRSRDICDKKLASISDWISKEDMFDILLLQGKEIEMMARNVFECKKYHGFFNINSSTAILLHNHIPIAGCSYFDTIGNSVVIFDGEDYLALFSIALSREKEVSMFKDIFLNYSLPRDHFNISSSIIGGSFPSKQGFDIFTKGLKLYDVLENADMKFEDMKDARYHLLVSSDLEVSGSSRKTLFTKEKVLTYSPISSVVRNKL